MARHCPGIQLGSFSSGHSARVIQLGPFLLGSREKALRPGVDASPVQLKYWTKAWLERIRDLYAAHDTLAAGTGMLPGLPAGRD
jgi:hypothetical protein